jgi:hypothetical protein
MMCVGFGYCDIARVCFYDLVVVLEEIWLLKDRRYRTRIGVGSYELLLFWVIE